MFKRISWAQCNVNPTVVGCQTKKDNATMAEDVHQDDHFNSYCLTNCQLKSQLRLVSVITSFILFYNHVIKAQNLWQVYQTHYLESILKLCMIQTIDRM